MKRKKLVSMLTAGALAVTMAMPVMAADGGSVDVTVTTKTGVLRVEVPTTLAIAVDQFETTDVGSQIYSEDFTIKNKSEVNVKVGVTSTANVKDGVALAAKRADVATATAAGGTAWLAVAAKVDGSHYEASNKLADLNETSANVTTFAENGTAATAAQTFYLEKATGAVSYAMLKSAEDGKTSVSYAQFYELTPQTLTSGSEQAELTALIATKDVYEVVTANIADEAVVTKNAKGGSITYAGTNTYYTMADAATPLDNVSKDKVYAYATLATAGTNADAAFRYIGALSSNKEVWDASDVPTVKIAYTIQGLPQSVYDAADSETPGIVYGLYKEKLPMVYSPIKGGYWLSVDGDNGFAAEPTSLTIDGTAKTVDTDYTYDGGWIELKADPGANKVIELVVNGTTYKVTTPAS